MTKNKTILVWLWEDAPEEYRALSAHGGDEDWVAFKPEGLRGECVDWLEPGSGFGRHLTSIHEVLGGQVYIGAHA